MNKAGLVNSLSVQRFERDVYERLQRLRDPGLRDRVVSGEAGDETLGLLPGAHAQESVQKTKLLVRRSLKKKISLSSHQR